MAFLVDQAERSWDSQRADGVLIMVFDAGGDSVSASVGTGANGEPLSTDAVIRVGSITKLLTSTTVLSLVDEGLVDLDAPRRHLRYWTQRRFALTAADH